MVLLGLIVSMLSYLICVHRNIIMIFNSSVQLTVWRRAIIIVIFIQSVVHYKLTDIRENISRITRFRIFRKSILNVSSVLHTQICIQHYSNIQPRSTVCSREVDITILTKVHGKVNISVSSKPTRYASKLKERLFIILCIYFCYYILHEMHVLMYLRIIHFNSMKCL